MKRDKHLQWAKDRALKEKDSPSMWTSFVSDMGKHDDLKDHICLDLGSTMLFSGMWHITSECEKFIEGFN